MPLIISAWWLPILAIPVLLLGEAIQRHFQILGRYNIPIPVVGGLSVCLLLLALDLGGVAALKFDTRVDAAWWTWLVTPEPEWATRPAKGVNLPFLIGFFTCIGLNATWSVVRKGSWQVPLFLGLATVLAVMQNVLGVGMAKLMGENPLLGLMCGSLSQTGGHGTALGFADTMERAGFPAAATVGAAAATFGLVFGSLVGGPVAARLIRKHGLAASPQADAKTEGRALKAEAALVESAHREPGIFSGIRAFVAQGKKAVFHLLMLAALIKIGAWASWGLQQAGLVFPAYMGALLAGLILRNLLDHLGKRWIDSHVVDLMGGIFLGIFLAMAMTSLNLRELAGSALPMLAILLVQLLMVILFTTFITFRVMGRDYDAAVMVSGHCGFSHGATPNAIANMDSITRKLGPAHRAFIIVPMVGGMFIDITNALNITWFLNLLK